MSNNNNRVKRGQAAVKAYLEVYANVAGAFVYGNEWVRLS